MHKKRNKNREKSNKNHKNASKMTGIIKVISKPMGFITVPEKDEEFVVFEENLNTALDKDEVEFEIIGANRDKKKARVLRVIKRNKVEFVGAIEKDSFGLFFKPDDFKFYKKVDLKNYDKNLKPNTKVLVRVDWNNSNLNPRGQILKIIGEKGEHETEMQSILIDKGIVYDFPTDVEEEAEEVAENWNMISEKKDLLERTGSFSAEKAPPSPASRGPKVVLEDFSFQKSERKDFRNILTFTIDPKDAKDFDDALSYEDLNNGNIRVGVHIADVSHFVRPNTALDREARKRSFSTYLVDRTIPMLPEVLSNDLCSLKPNVDRFAFSAVFDIKKDTGQILDRWFGKTIINSQKRFTYEEAQEMLDKANSEKSPSSESPRVSSFSSVYSSAGEARLSSEDFFLNSLFELNRIAKIYREENKKNGAIEFETDEVKFELDQNGKPLKIYKKERLDTMKMIEEWMLLANREVAKFISDPTSPNQSGLRGINNKERIGIFRVHGLPKMEKIEDLAIFVRALGHDLPIKNGEVSAKDINILLKQIEGHASESLIKTATIRSMAKAEYSTSNIGHFGLAFEYYTHFTSPIRRYPDLLVHRILERYLNNQPIPKNEFSKFQKIADETSEKEINIQEAERNSIKYKQVEFMQDKIDQEFDCVISGVAEWGMYVEDPETKVEGLVRIKDLTDDFYKIDQKNYCIVGEKTKKKYSVGDSVRVRLISADLDRKTLDFKLV